MGGLRLIVNDSATCGVVDAGRVVLDLIVDAAAREVAGIDGLPARVARLHLREAPGASLAGWVADINPCVATELVARFPTAVFETEIDELGPVVEWLTRVLTARRAELMRGVLA